MSLDHGDDFFVTNTKRLEEGIKRIKITAESVFKTFTKRNEALGQEMSAIVNKINLSQQAYNKYMSQANSVGLSESYASQVRNGSMNIATITDENLSKKISDYQEWYDKAEDVKTSIMELNEELSELAQQKFDNIGKDFDGVLGVIEHYKNMLDESITQTEEKGYIVSVKYYEALKKQEQDNITQLEKERTALLSALNSAVASGQIEKNSEAWNEMCSDIDDVTLAIEQANTSMIKYNNSIREIEWQVFDMLQDKITDITKESDFLIDLMSNDKLYEDNGQLTDDGNATMGLHGMNYNVYMAQADKYAQEMKKLDSEIAKDPYNQDLIERRKELLELQQEMILAAEDEKDAIVDMVQQGIELELDSLKELIDTYLDALDAQKNLYDYQKKVEEQTKEISSLEKQMAAYEGDTSEEAKAKIQQIKVSLEQAKENLEETNYDKYISDQKMLLDELYMEYETILNERLDNVDALIGDMITEINNSASNISTTLSDKADSVGYTLSENMTNIWNTSTSSITSVLTTYGNNFVNAATTINNTLGTINTNISNMISQLNKIAETKVQSAASSSSSNSSSASGTAGGSSGHSSGNSSSGSGNSGSSWGSWFIHRVDRYPKNRLQVNTSIVDRLKYHDFDSSMSARRNYFYAMGGSGNYIGTDSQNMWMIREMKSHGYKKGVYNLKQDELAWTQEGHREEVIMKKDGSLLTPLSKGSSVFNANATENLYSFANDPREFMNKLHVSNPIPILRNINSGVNNNEFKMEVVLPNVMDYKDFKKEMQHDKGFEKMIEAMTIGKLSGGSSMNKYRY